MTTMLEPRCFSRQCRWFIGPTGDGKIAVLTCAAFPKGMPEEIAYGDNDHTSSVEGDNGIRYERLEGAK